MKRRPRNEASETATHVYDVGVCRRVTENLVLGLLGFLGMTGSGLVAMGQGPGVDQGQAPSAATHFAKSKDCALCHSYSSAARAMRDGWGENVAPYDLWSGTMMANSAVDPYWRAAVSAEVAATPTQKEHIETVCTRCHAPMAAPVESSPAGELLAFLKAEHPKALLGRDGVSCTVCHQITPEGFGTEASFTGGFVLNRESRIYGPHADPVTMPMQRHVQYTPTKGDHILRSAMCATCHTLITGSFDSRGNETHQSLHEQVPYLEWRNSIFNDEVAENDATGRSCQSCHVPTADRGGEVVETRLAHNPAGRDFPFLNPRKPYGRHTFAGGNVFMTQLIRDNRERLGITTPREAFDRAIQDSKRMLETQTASLELGGLVKRGATTVLPVHVFNRAGHKFPTAYPSRRAWIELVVRDGAGKVVFASGESNARGELIDAEGKLISSEVVGGPIQPHYREIASSSEVQIYESLMHDSEGRLTFTLLRGSTYGKDNRLLPQGWREGHADAEATRPVGVDGDEDYVAGGDTTAFVMELPAGRYEVTAKLRFQSLSQRYVAELMLVETKEVQEFAAMYERANRSPETIAEVKKEVVVGE